MSALNRAYDTTEQRSFWHRRILSVVLVVSLGMSLVFLFNLIVFSEQIEAWLRSQWDFTRDVPSLVGISRSMAGIFGTVMVTACIYRIAPNLRQRWIDVLPGSVLFFVLWTFIAGGFKYYVQSFSYYNVVSGVLGGVIVLLLSAYLVAFTLLLGGELNGALFRWRSHFNVAT
jgi:membrane protein